MSFKNPTLINVCFPFILSYNVSVLEYPLILLQRFLINPLSLTGEFPVLKSGEDTLTSSSKIMDYLREKV